MAAARFDPTKAVIFDLEQGLIHLEGGPGSLLVPADILLALCEAAGPQGSEAFGRSLGDGMGRRLVRRLSTDSPEGVAAVCAADVDAVVDQLGGEFSLAGLGSLAIERWG